MENSSATPTAQRTSSRTNAASSLIPVQDPLQRRSSSSQGHGDRQAGQKTTGHETADAHSAAAPALSDRALASTGSDGSNDLQHTIGRKPASRQFSEIVGDPSTSREHQRRQSQVTVEETPPSPPTPPTPQPNGSQDGSQDGPGPRSIALQIRHAVITFGKFIGPGFMIAVAYIDPGNYATDIAAGATYRSRLLFIVLLSNLFAILLQSLCIKLGTVTGLNLAEACRAFLPRWLNYVLYIMAEVAIIATDLAEVS